MVKCVAAGHCPFGRWTLWCGTESQCIECRPLAAMVPVVLWPTSATRVLAALTACVDVAVVAESAGLSWVSLLLLPPLECHGRMYSVWRHWEEALWARVWQQQIAWPLHTALECVVAALIA